MAQSQLETTLKKNISLSTGGALIIAPDPTQLQQVYSLVPKVLGWKKGTLENFKIEYKDQSTFEEILVSLSTQNLFQQPRLFLVSLPERASTLKADPFANLLSRCSERDFILFYATKLAARSSIRKYFEKSGALVELKELKGEELIKWATRELHTHGINEIDAENIKMLVDFSDSSPERLQRMIEQLAVYVDDERCTASDILTLFSGYPDPNEFMLFDLIRKGDMVGIEKTLEEIFQSGKNAFLLLALISKVLSNYLAVRRLLAIGERKIAVADRLGMKPWAVQKAIEATRGIPIWKLEQVLELIVASDCRLKSTSVEPQEFLGDMLWRLHP